MKYQSEIIKEIVDNRGHEKSSLHYESECVEYWIEETKGSYPKLTDYESEWLNYMEENHVGMFPYITLSDETNATVENVVPYSYKSAILKGQTLVNLFKNKVTHRDTGKFIYVEEGDKIQATFKDGVTNGWMGFSFKENVPFEIGKTYTVMNELYKCDDQLSSFNISLGNKTFVNAKPVIGINKLKIIIPSDYTEGINWMYYNVNNTNNSATIFSSNLLILEGDYTQEDIPYFTGMQSVKMPVLTTTGKNLFDGKWIKGKMIAEDGSIISDNGSQYSESFIRVSKGKYISSNNGTNRNVNIFKYDFDGNFIGRLGTTGSTFTVDGDFLIRFSLGVNNTDYFQFEQGTVATTYEPYKSNILTVNEEVELRGIGDVQDTLDLLTGEVTERIGEIVLDGSENWVFGRDTTHATNGRVLGFKIQIPNLYATKWDGTKADTIVCDKLKVTSQLNQFTGEVYNSISQCSPTEIQIMIKAINNSLNDTLNEIKRMLSENPVTVVYPVNDVIKTVDLTITNQDGETLNKIKPIEGTMHIATDGNPIKPLFSGEIPVEAITQNLATFIKE